MLYKFANNNEESYTRQYIKKAKSREVKEKKANFGSKGNALKLSKKIQIKKMKKSNSNNGGNVIHNLILKTSGKNNIHKKNVEMVNVEGDSLLNYSNKNKVKALTIRYTNEKERE